MDSFVDRPENNPPGPDVDGYQLIHTPQPRDHARSRDKSPSAMVNLALQVADKQLLDVNCSFSFF
ncbi:hypothetical protein [Aureitalea marina]|uniref:hypothetical protein n=1 Tax=Aureitalea marina TaxID=930804 RepID=UPI0011B0DFD2|nr:hypothetical protein [Aureitalea marina]